MNRLLPIGATNESTNQLLIPHSLPEELEIHTLLSLKDFKDIVISFNEQLVDTLIDVWSLLGKIGVALVFSLIGFLLIEFIGADSFTREFIKWLNIILIAISLLFIFYCYYTAYKSGSKFEKQLNSIYRDRFIEIKVATSKNYKNITLKYKLYIRYNNSLYPHNNNNNNSNNENNNSISSNKIKSIEKEPLMSISR